MTRSIARFPIASLLSLAMPFAASSVAGADSSAAAETGESAVPPAQGEQVRVGSAPC